MLSTHEGKPLAAFKQKSDRLGKSSPSHKVDPPGGLAQRNDRIQFTHQKDLDRDQDGSSAHPDV